MLTDPVFERVREIISNLFNVPAEQITPESSMETVEPWDSMGHLMLVLELEQEFDRVLPPEETEKMTSVAAIVHVLED